MKYSNTDITCINGDFLNYDPLDPKFSNVQLILLDPSCSGSGMLNEIFRRQNDICDENE
jgi:putative methyltransferase